MKLKKSLPLIGLLLLIVPAWTFSGEDHATKTNLKNKTTDRIAKKHTQAPLQILKEVRLEMPANQLFDMLADHENMPKWIPFLHKVTVDNSLAKVAGGQGAMRTCYTADGQTLTEDIVYFKSGRAYAYAVRDDNMMGLKSHLGVFHVKKDGRGSLLTWGQYFNHPMPEQAIPGITQMMDMILQGLIEKHGGQLLAAN